MKKLLFFLFAALAFVACTQNDVEELAANRQTLPETLTVGFEGSDTRIQLNEVQKTVWNAGDEVSVFYQSYTNMKWTFQGEDGDRSGVLKAEDKNYGEQVMDDIIIVYPYSSDYRINLNNKTVLAKLPASQRYKDGSYGKGGNIMVTAGDLDSYKLRSVCGWLRIDLTGDGQTVHKITLRGNNEEQLAGLVNIDMQSAEIASFANDSSLVVEDALYTEITLNCSEGVELGAESKSFYIGVLPQTFEKGLTINIECNGCEPMTISTTAKLVIERNHIKPLESVEHSSEYKDDAKQILYTATEMVKAHSRYPWTLDTFGANILSHEWNSATGEGVITFDTSVKTIGDYAFYKCSSLTSITIPDSVTTIGWGAFLECNNLSEFSSQFAKDNGRILVIDGSLVAFAPAGLTEYSIPDGVMIIGGGTFYSCNSLTSITIPNSVTAIEDRAFYNCDSLTSVTIGDSVTTIGDGAFSDCDNLTSVTMGDNVTTIGEWTFAYCYNLTSITIPDSITTIGWGAFAYCDSLTSITTGDSVTTIGDQAFYGCSHLSSVTFGNSLTTIGEWAFCECSRLSSVTIPDSVTTIGDWAFRGCTFLTSVTISDNSVATIGDGVFYECTYLSSVTIGKSVEIIGDDVFAHCLYLRTVYCKATTPPTVAVKDGYWGAFARNASDLKIYVPIKSVEAYKSAEYWSNKADYIVGYDFEKGEVAE